MALDNTKDRIVHATSELFREQGYEVAETLREQLPERARGSAQTTAEYEQILAGRDVRDAIFIASRCCGYHGGQHAIAAAQAVEMALGLEPPPMAVGAKATSTVQVLPEATVVPL